MATAPDPLAVYCANAAERRATRVADARVAARLDSLRLAAFIGLVLLVARWATTAELRAVWLGAVVAALVAFIALVRASGRSKDRLRHADNLILLADEGAARVRRDWARLPKREWRAEAASHPYAVDLDLYGDASLVQLMPSMSAAPGRATLQQWLTAPADPGRITARQRAVEELRGRTVLRDELAIAGLRMSLRVEQLTELVKWARDDGWLLGQRVVVSASVSIPCLTIALIGAQATGLVTRPYWIAPVVVGWLLLLRYGRALSASLAPVVGRSTTLRRYALMARLARDEQFASPMLASIHERLTGTQPADAGMRRLTALADCAALRLSPMSYVLVNALTLWDFHIVHLLERWRRTSGARVSDWLSAMGELESLSALATLAHDNPSWTFPEITSGSPTVAEAEALGHPLLADDVGVRNDVTVGPAGTLLVVTGSNMAGKSTLLRSIGLNLVLSQAGSVVCARRLRHPAANLYTSMRVQDSLERGVSYFMAELQRLKAVVDAADAAPPGGQRVLVYLLDEILHGTSSAERTIAARHVLGHLATTGAIGAVSTHDLQLVDVPELEAIARHVHFQEQFSRVDGVASMRFDYRMRPGRATSRNALQLLEMVGLGKPLA